MLLITASIFIFFQRNSFYGGYWGSIFIYGTLVLMSYLKFLFRNIGLDFSRLCRNQWRIYCTRLSLYLSLYPSVYIILTYLEMCVHKLVNNTMVRQFFYRIRFLHNLSNRYRYFWFLSLFLFFFLFTWILFGWICTIYSDFHDVLGIPVSEKKLEGFD